MIIIEEYGIILGHSQYISGIDFSETSSYIVTGSHDGTLIIYDIINNKEMNKLNLSIPIKALKYSRDGKILILTDDNLIHIWDSYTMEKHDEISIFGTKKEYIKGSITNKYIICADFLKSGRYIVIGCQDKKIYIIPLYEKGVAIPLLQQEGPIFSVGWINKRLVYSAAQGADLISIWDWKKKKIIAQVSNGKSTVSSNGQFIATSPSTKKIKIWDSNTGSLKKLLSPRFFRIEVIESMSFHPQKNQLITGMSLGTIKLWNIDSNKYVSIKKAHNVSINRIKFSYCGKYLASADRNNLIKLWKV
ncbi:WD40 repeat domain-containing protein [Natronospora cellulosivora (SeqCode)]